MHCTTVGGFPLQAVCGPAMLLAESPAGSLGLGLLSTGSVRFEELQQVVKRRTADRPSADHRRDGADKTRHSESRVFQRKGSYHCVAMMGSPIGGTTTRPGFAAPVMALCSGKGKPISGAHLARISALGRHPKTLQIRVIGSARRGRVPRCRIRNSCNQPHRRPRIACIARFLDLANEIATDDQDPVHPRCRQRPIAGHAEGVVTRADHEFLRPVSSQPAQNLQMEEYARLRKIRSRHADNTDQPAFLVDAPTS